MREIATNEAGFSGSSPEAPAAWLMPTTDFRARQTRFALRPAERATVARRSLFYTMPWLRQSNAHSDDFLP